MTSDPATPHNPENPRNSENTAAKTVVISRPVHSIADLGAGIIDAIYAPDVPAADTLAANTSAANTSGTNVNPDARPVPRNLDALADLLRETQTDRLVVTDWRASEELTIKLLNVFAHEGITLVRG